MIRRDFLKGTAAGMIGSAMFLNSCNKQDKDNDYLNKYEDLDKEISKPVLKTAYFNSPIIIKQIELLRYQNSFICRVESQNGDTGISISNNMQMISLYPLFVNRVQPYFLHRDARELDTLIDEVYDKDSNYKHQGIGFWICVATLEFAILDMLGKIGGLSIGKLIGEIHNEEIAIYRANDYRGKSAEESVRLIKEEVEKLKSKAVKCKVSGRMNNAEIPQGRSEKLIPLLRKTLGDDITIYADSNGGYDVKEAIRIGKILQENNFGFFEEPVPFDCYEETKVVKEALDIPIAGGEQEPSMNNFRWLIHNNALDVVQPDIFYFGGMIRSMKVARMAEIRGKKCVPHISGSGLGYIYMLHFVSALSNSGKYHEFKGFTNEVELNEDIHALNTGKGTLSVPTAPGLGFTLSEQFINKHSLVTV